MLEHDVIMVEQFWGGDEYWTSGDGENSKQWPQDKITDAQLDYIFAELRYEASQYDDETGIFAGVLSNFDVDSS